MWANMSCFFCLFVFFFFEKYDLLCCAADLLKKLNSTDPLKDKDTTSRIQSAADLLHTLEKKHSSITARVLNFYILGFLFQSLTLGGRLQMREDPTQRHDWLGMSCISFPAWNALHLFLMNQHPHLVLSSIAVFVIIKLIKEYDLIKTQAASKEKKICLLAVK